MERQFELAIQTGFKVTQLERELVRNDVNLLDTLAQEIAVSIVPAVKERLGKFFSQWDADEPVQLEMFSELKFNPDGTLTVE